MRLRKIYAESHPWLATFRPTSSKGGKYYKSQNAEYQENHSTQLIDINRLATIPNKLLIRES